MKSSIAIAFISFSCALLSACNNNQSQSTQSTASASSAPVAVAPVTHDQAYYKAHIDEAKARAKLCDARGVNIQVVTENSPPEVLDCAYAAHAVSTQPYVPDNSKPAFHG